MRLRGFDKFEGPVLIDTETVRDDERIEGVREFHIAFELDDGHVGLGLDGGLDSRRLNGREMGLAVSLPTEDSGVYGTSGIIVAFELNALC